MQYKSFSVFLFMLPIWLTAISARVLTVMLKKSNTSFEISKCVSYCTIPWMDPSKELSLMIIMLPKWLTAIIKRVYLNR